MSRPDYSEAGQDEDLQFQVDGLASLADGDRAFSRAVCVPFAVHQDMAAPLGSLEGKVQQLVTDYLAVAAGVDGDSGLLSPLAAHLAKHGLQAVVTAPPKPSALSPLSTRSINAPFLVVTQPSADDRRDAVVGDKDQNQAKEAPQVVVVDVALREHLALAPATPAYQRSLAAAVPEVFVGTRVRLARLVSSLGPAIAANFSAQGMEQPPWRRKSALLHRWASVEDQERRLHLQWEYRRKAGSQQQQQEQERQSLKPSASVGDLQEFEVAWPEGMPALYAPAAARTAEVVSIVGFEVGSVAVGREPWYDAQPGAFSESVFRRPSLAESDVSSADSEEVITGMSPVSVFRDAPAAAQARSAKVVVGFA